MADKEAILDSYITCTCNEGYKTRKLADPTCPRHSFSEDIEAAMDTYSKELIKENEELKRLISMKYDDEIKVRTSFEAKDKEIERLKGLCLGTYSNYVNTWEMSESDTNAAVQQFKIKNNL